MKWTFHQDAYTDRAERLAYKQGRAAYHLGMTINASTGVVGTTTDVTVHDAAQSVILHLVNQFANEFVNDPAAYVLAQDTTLHLGTSFELHV